jgi:hypothetical protein
MIPPTITETIVLTEETNLKARELEKLRREATEALNALTGLHDPGSCALRVHLREVLAEIDRLR